MLESCVLTWGGRRARAAQVREHAANVQQTAWAVAAAIPMCAHRRGTVCDYMCCFVCVLTWSAR